MMTTLKIGKNKGLSFIELMLTIVILSSGLVFIYKAFFISLSSFNYLTNRLYAMNLMSNQIASLRQTFAVTNDITKQLGQTTKTITFNGKPVDFVLDKKANTINSTANLYEAEVLAGWKEGNRDFKVTQSAYVGGF